jgi:hypothetical protein
VNKAEDNLEFDPFMFPQEFFERPAVIVGGVIYKCGN